MGRTGDVTLCLTVISRKPATYWVCIQSVYRKEEWKQPRLGVSREPGLQAGAAVCQLGNAG